MAKEPTNRFEPGPRVTLEGLTGRKNLLVKITLGVHALPGQSAYLLVPLDAVIEALVEFAAADTLDYVLANAFPNGDAVRLEMRRIVPKPKCPKCGTECA
jgi:hypothetical protein